MADKSVTIDVIGRDRASSAFDRAGRAADRLAERTGAADRASRGAADGSSRWGRELGILRGIAQRAGVAVGRMTAAVGLAGASLPLAGLAAVKLAVALGKVASASAPLLSALPVLAGAGGLVGATFALAFGDAARKSEVFKRSVEPLTTAVGRLQQRLTETSMRGVRPLLADFVRLNMPALGGAMTRVAAAANRAAVGFGRWVNSGEGQRIVADLSERTADAFERLAPKLRDIGISIGRLAGRAIGPTFDRAVPALERLADRAKRFIDGLSVKDIEGAWRDLSGLLAGVRRKLRMLRDVGKWMVDNEEGVRQFSNALAGVALVAGVASGGWMLALGAGLTLLANNWDTVRTRTTGAARAVDRWVKKTPEAQRVIATTRAEFDRFGAAVQRQVDIIVPQARRYGRAMERGFKAWEPQIRWGIRVLGWLARVTVGTFGSMASGILVFFTAATNLSARIGRVFNRVARRIKGAFKNPKGFLGDIGRQIVDGLAAGIRGAGHLVVDAAKALAGLLPDWVKRVLDIRSPSRVFRRIGGHVIDGWAEGMRVRGARLRQVVERLARGLDTSAGKATTRLAGALGARLRSALDRLSALRQARTEFVRDAAARIRESGSLASLELPESGNASTATLLEQLQGKAAAVRGQRSVLARLRKMGLGKGALQQLMEMDPADAARLGRGLIAGGRNAIRQVNALQADIARSAKGTASAMGRQLYGAGIEAARGMVRGLMRGRKALLRLASRMGHEVAKAVREALKIKSPSRVMDVVGQQTVQGMARGVARTQRLLTRQMRATAGATVRVARQAAPARIVTAAAGPAAAPVSVTVNVTSPLASPDQIRRAVVDAFQRGSKGGPRLPRTAVA